jgi:GT2 family glycosyltransferase
MIKDVSIIIVNYNTADLLVQAIQSIFQANIKYSFEIIVVDNASSDDSCLRVKETSKEVILIENRENVGFSKANNQGIVVSNGNNILFLNSDTIVLENTVNYLIEFLNSHPNVAAGGPKLLNFDRSLQRSWFDFPNPVKTFLNLLGISFYLVKLKRFKVFKYVFGKSNKPAFLIDNLEEERAVDYLTLACLLVRKQTLIQIGCLDENIFFYHEDCELGYKLRNQKLATYYLPKYSIIHLGGSSSQKRIISSFQQYYLNLTYIYKKHEPTLSFFMNAAIVLAINIRMLLWFFGLYRHINMFGVYAGNPQKKDVNRPKASAVLAGYYNTLKAIIRK